MAKKLLAVVSCHSRPEFADAIRNTWAQRVPKETDIKFFKGRGATPQATDEVLIDCDDTHAGLPEKVQAIATWAYDHGYDFVSKIDDDVVMDPVRFLALVGHHDYMGMGKSEDGAEHLTAMPYGFCYTLSRKAMKVVMDSTLPGQDKYFEVEHKKNDEYWVMLALKKEKIYLHVEWSCRLWDGAPSIYPELPDTTVFCVHMHGTLSKPEEVHEMCRIWRASFQNG